MAPYKRDASMIEFSVKIQSNVVNFSLQKSGTKIRICQNRLDSDNHRLKRSQMTPQTPFFGKNTYAHNAYIRLIYVYTAYIYVFPLSHIRFGTALHSPHEL
jgi:hypothetical protein